MRPDNSRTDRLYRKGLLPNPPKWLISNLMFEGIAGSEAYGCSDKGSSDIDIVGITIPPKYIVFPHLAGNIHGFETPETFDQYQQQHIEDKETARVYDLTIYGIVKFFRLTADCNPNMIDSLFLPHRCITKSSQVYEHLRDNRKLFLSRKVFYRFRGYANAQLAKLNIGRSRENPKRSVSIEKFGYDVKFAYHLVRLLEESSQILSTGDLILDRDSKLYRSIRNGEWELERVKNWFTSKERELTELLPKSVVPEKVDFNKIRKVLLDCLEMHYGSLENTIINSSREERILDDLERVLGKYGRVPN